MKILLALTILTLAIPAAAENLIPNGDFTESLDGWDISVSMGAPYLHSVNWVPEEGGALEIDVSCASDICPSGISIQLSQGELYIPESGYYTLTVRYNIDPTCWSWGHGESLSVIPLFPGGLPLSPGWRTESCTYWFEEGPTTFDPPIQIEALFYGLTYYCPAPDATIYVDYFRLEWDESVPAANSNWSTVKSLY